MAVHTEITRSVDEAPGGAQVGAFFDFDGTLIAGYSVFEFFKEQVSKGRLSSEDLVETMTAAGNFGMGNLSFTGFMTSSANMMTGIEEASYKDYSRKVYEKQIARLIYPEARELVQAHLNKGHTVAIISSATLYHIEPAAQDMDIEHILCTRFEVKDGEFTGQLVKPICWEEGKLSAAERLAESHGINLDESFFYTDGDADLKLLDRVGHPTPLNPNSKLTRIAEQRGWSVRHFEGRGRPRVTDFFSSMVADMSQIPSLAASLPAWSQAGSGRNLQNIAFSMFADLASNFIGLTLKVKGDHHLWQQRPAVFVFNHQSKADFMITARLVRRDTNFAIGSLAALAETIRADGKSVLIAPEGTRSLTRKLLPFKHDAFQLALQAGVPMIPIVIHNANDVAPKGDFIYRRAKVEVEILPPIDTGGWRAETIDEHVAEVRHMYLKTLGQQID